MSVLMPSTGRRSPQQRRSQEKVDRILNGCEQLLATLPLGEVTVTMVIKQSGVSAGTFYAYFRNLEAVTERLSTRYIEEVNEVIAAWAKNATVESWEDVVDGLIGAYLEWALDRPAFLGLWASEQFGANLREFEQEANNYLAILLKEQIVGVYAGAAAMPDRVFRFTVELIDRMARFAFREDNGSRRQSLFDDTALAARGYLGQYLAPTSSKA